MKHIGIFLLSLVVGFLAVTGAYLLVTRQHVQILSPVVPTKFSLDNPPSQSLVGNISSLSGDILWQSRTNQQLIITSPQKIQQGETLETGSKGQITIVFTDVATISAARNTKFSIVQTLPANLVIQQIQGQI